MHPDLTIAVAHDRHVRRTAAVEAWSTRPEPPAAVMHPPLVVLTPVAPVRLRVIPGGRAGGSDPSTGSRPAA